MDKDPEPGMDDLVDKGLGTLLRRVKAAGKLDGFGVEELIGRRDEEKVVEPMPESIGGYPIVELIGRGGVGLVYRGVDPVFGRTVAIKLLAQRHAADLEMVARFHEEARICSCLQHPGVVPLYASGEFEDGRPYFTMRVVEGDTLAESLADRPDDSSQRQRFLEIFSKVCQTVAYAQAQGVVHSDLKPSNVMVGAFGEIQIMDWGFARSFQPSDLGDSIDPGSDELRVTGTPAYMSPEQARGEESSIGPATDVFGLGAILCEILTGEPPYTGESRPEVFLKATQCWLSEAFERLDDCGADARLIDLCKRCLAKDPADRPADAGLVQGEIATYLESLEERARRAEQDIGEARAHAAEARAHAAEERRARRLTLALAASVLISILAGLGLWAWLEVQAGELREDTSRAVSAAIDRALRLQVEARLQPPDKYLGWDEALVAAQQAADFAHTREAQPAARERAEALVAEVEAERLVAAHSHQMLHWLDDVRPHLSDDRGSGGIDADYLAGFAGFDLPVDTGDPQVLGARIAASPIRQSLVTALEDWARIRSQKFADDPEAALRLLRIADVADPDPWRMRLRSALADGDAETLVELSDDEELVEVPPQTINLLAKCLYDLGERERAIDVLRSGLIRHPEDFWMVHDLASFLQRIGSEDRTEVIGLRMTAASLRPDNAHVLTDYAAVLLTKQESERALVLLDRALRLDPDFHRAWRYRCWALAQQQRWAEAAEMAERSIGDQKGDYEAHRIHAEALIQLGRFAEARRAAERSLELRPDQLRALAAISRASLQLRDMQTAIDSMLQVSRLQPDSTLALYQLGDSLCRASRYDEAIDALHSALVLAKNQGESEDEASIAGLLRWAESWQAAAARLDDVAAGRHTPSQGEWRWIADAAWFARDFRIATEFYAKTALAQPSEFVRHRAKAYLAAAALGAGLGSLDPGDSAAAEARALALQWIDDELLAWHRLCLVGTQPPWRARAWAVAALNDAYLQPYWVETPAFLTVDERLAWRALQGQLLDFVDSIADPK